MAETENPHYRDPSAAQTGEVAESTGEPHPFDQKWVYYNDGSEAGEDCHSLVVKDKKSGDTLLDLYPLEGLRHGELVPDVPRREKVDYGPEGGGHTWHV